MAVGEARIHRAENPRGELLELGACFLLRPLGIEIADNDTGRLGEHALLDHFSEHLIRPRRIPVGVLDKHHAPRKIGQSPVFRQLVKPVQKPAHRESLDRFVAGLHNFQFHIRRTSRHHVAHPLDGRIAGIAERRQHRPRIRMADPFDHHRIDQHRQVAESDDAHVSLFKFLPVENIDDIARTFAAVGENEKIDLGIHP